MWVSFFEMVIETDSRASDQVFLGTILGAAIGMSTFTYPTNVDVMISLLLGYIFSFIMKFSHKKGFIDRDSYVAQYLALAIFTMGIVNTIGSDDLLAAFAAGAYLSTLIYHTTDSFVLCRLCYFLGWRL